VPDTDDVITSRDGRVGRILLNRLRVLNTLTLDMVRVFTRALHDFAADPHLHAVVVEGAGSASMARDFPWR
jgi:enoyl-CoA hydratase